MKISSAVDEQEFVPFEIKITVETRNELKTLFALHGGTSDNGISQLSSGEYLLDPGDVEGSNTFYDYLDAHCRGLL